MSNPLFARIMYDSDAMTQEDLCALLVKNTDANAYQCRRTNDAGIICDIRREKHTATLRLSKENPSLVEIDHADYAGIAAALTIARLTRLRVRVCDQSYTFDFTVAPHDSIEHAYTRARTGYFES